MDLVADATSKAAEEILAEQYINAITPPSPPPPKQSKQERSTSKWEKDNRAEQEDLERAKHMIRTKQFPPYFQTEEGNYL